MRVSRVADAATPPRSRKQSKRGPRRSALAAVVAIASALGVVVLVTAPKSHPRPRARAFAWVRPETQPRDWKVAATRSGATLAYPPGWREIQTDPGTASAAPAGVHGVFTGYLNATPRSGDETLANWSRFRVAHIGAEGARRVRLEAAATGLYFRSAVGSCVIDSYSTSKARFREIACIIAGAHAATVVVAAAPVAAWAQKVALLERAVASFTA
jgi:hypothetical protein